jgi:hypothetical protein
MVHLVHLVKMDLEVHQEVLEYQDQLDLKESLVQVVLLVQMEHLARLDQVVLQEHLEHQDQLVQQE